MKHLHSLLIIALAILTSSCANRQLSESQGTMPWRGVVYDVGLKYGPGETFSVDSFNKKQIEYDLAVIADSLHCNIVRIEGESIERLEFAAEVAHSHGLRVFFNPWKMNSTEDEVVAYEGAAEKGSGGFTVLQGTDDNGEPVYVGGKPKRNEDVQADYIETQINLLKDTGVSGMFVFVYSFPIYPYREEGFDADMTSFALVKTFAPEDPRSKLSPPYAPKAAFHKVAEIYGKFLNEEQ